MEDDIRYSNTFYIYQHDGKFYRPIPDGTAYVCQGRITHELKDGAWVRISEDGTERPLPPGTMFETGPPPTIFTVHNDIWQDPDGTIHIRETHFSRCIVVKQQYIGA